MEQRLTCDTVRDLLPLYVEHMTSAESDRSIAQHLQTCAACREILEQMQQPIQAETVPELTDVKKYLRKSKLTILGWILGIAAGIAIVTCFIVNLAVEGRLSWFYIVLASIATAYLPVLTGIYCRRHRFLKGLAVLNLCTVFLLVIIQIVLYCYWDETLWLWTTGLPITLLWSAFIWISVATHLFLHVNVVISISILFFLSIPGTYWTNVLAGYYHGLEEYASDFAANGLGNTIAAAVLLAIGIALQIWQHRKNRR